MNFFVRNAYLTVGLCITIFFLPIFFHPQILLNRNNDLLEFRQNYVFFKQTILENHHLPLWQNRILSGAPYLGDPQNPLGYIPNYFVLFLPVDIFFLISFYLHFLLSGWGMVRLAKKFGLRGEAAIFAGLTYALSPVFIGHLEAGHLNMLVAFAYFPLFLSSLRGICQSRSKVEIVILALSAAAIFLNYITIFLYAIVAGAILLVRELWGKFKTSIHTIKPLFLSGFLFFILVCPQLIMELRYLPLTTRDLIVLEDIGPTVVSGRRFVKSIIFPYWDGINLLSGETVLYFGLLPLILSSLGFWYLGHRDKFIFLILVLVSVFLALGPKTQLYVKFIETLPQLKILRIITRHWFVLVAGVALLGAYALKRFPKKARILITIGLFVELVFFSQTYLHSVNSELVELPKIPKLLRSLLNQPGYFRLACPTGCISDVTSFYKGLAFGYNPIMLKNYYDFFQTASGFRFGSYAVSLPPYQTFVDENQPKSQEMGVLGVRYLASRYQLVDPGFEKIGVENGFNYYKNRNELPRVYLENETRQPITPTKDLPGLVQIPTEGKLGTLVINEIYTPFWTATDETGKKLAIQKNHNIVLEVPLTREVKEVWLTFAPGFSELLFITLGVSVVCYLFLLYALVKRIV